VSFELKPLPLSEEELEQYRIRTLRQAQPGPVGGHITRRMGESLEFREHTYYSPGDDIRHVDWRASTRPNWRSLVRQSDGWLVRRFEAEEQLRIVVSIDTRETMRLPVAMPKLQIAAWLVQALSFVALRSDYQIVHHRLFGTAPKWSSRLRSRAGMEQYIPSLRNMVAEPDTSERLSLEGLERYLPPAAVWVIISDYYFGAEAAQQLAQRINAAQRGWRWIILIELDSWPYERARLDFPPYARRISGPASVEPKKLRIDDSLLKSVEAKINDHRAAFERQLKKVSLEQKRWCWDEEANPPSFFRSKFGEEKVFQELFRKKQW